MRRVRLSITFLLLFIISHGKAQSLIGTWQLGSKKSGGEGINDCYIFKADKTFEYRPNNDQGLNRILAIVGTYKQYKGYVELTPKYTRELVGGVIDRSHITTGNDSWSIENGTVKKQPIAKPIVQNINITFTGTAAFVVEETNTFYKIK